MGFKRVAFLISSTLPLLLILGWQHHVKLISEEKVILQEKMDDLNKVHSEIIRGLDEIYQENDQLFYQLVDALDKIENVEKRNTELERTLFNQRETYRNAVALQGSTMPVLSKSEFTACQYERAFSQLNARGLMGTGEAFVKAEKIYGVNSLVLVCIAYLESAGGMSQIARVKNNLFGLGAADGSAFASALTFSSKEDSIDFAANLLQNNYLSRSGRFYRGDNLQAINIRYASDPRWAEKIGQTMALVARLAIPEGR